MLIDLDWEIEKINEVISALDPSQSNKNMQNIFNTYKRIINTTNTNVDETYNTLNNGKYSIIPVNETKYNIKNENNEIIFTVNKLENGQYLLAHEDGMQETIYESILQEPMERIKRVTTDLFIHGEELFIKCFADNGASITIIGKQILETFYKYLDTKNKKTIVAGGFDSNNTKQFYKSNTKLLLPIRTKWWNAKERRTENTFTEIEAWYFDCIAPELCILGRDGQKAIGLGLYSQYDLSKAMYLHNRNKLFNFVPNTEDVRNYFDSIEYKHSGAPGIYRITPNNEVVQFKAVFAKKSQLRNVNNNVNCVHLYALESDNTLKQIETVNYNQIQYLEDNN